MLEILYYFSTIFYLFLSGLLIRDFRDKNYLYFSILLAGITVWTFTLYLYLFVDVGTSLLFIGRLNYAAGVLIAFGIVSFFYSFPRKIFRFNSIVEKVFVAYTIFLFFISLFTPMIDAQEVMTEHGPEVVLGEQYYLYSIYLGISILLPVFFGFKKIVKLSGLENLRFRYSFLTFVPAYSLGYIIATILPIFGIMWHFQYMFLVFVPGIVFTFYSLTRYRFFNISQRLLNGLRSFILISILVVVSLGTFYLTKVALPQVPQELLLITAVLVSSGVLVIAKQFFPEFTTKEFQEFKNSLQDLRLQMYNAKTYKELLKMLEDTFVLQLHVAAVRLYVIREEEEDVGIPVYESDEFSKEVEKSKLLTLSKGRMHELKKLDDISQMFFDECLSNLNAQILFPLYSENKLIGFCALGEKDGGEGFSSEEITELKTIRKALEISFMNILLNQDLKEENDVMKIRIKEATEKLEKIVRQQADFIAVTSHEFRTPLSIAMFQLEDTVESHEHDEDLLSDLSTVVGSLENLKQLTERMFSVQQYDLDKIELLAEKVKIGSCIENTFESFKPLMKEENIQFKFLNNLKKETGVFLDKKQMNQVFHNLLTNAKKFTPEGGIVHLELNEDKDFVYISVTDSGKGIPESERETIFEKFRTVRVASGSGIGLGLYLCKKIIELHKGDIWIEDDEKLSGAKFVFKLGK